MSTHAKIVKIQGNSGVLMAIWQNNLTNLAWNGSMTPTKEFIKCGTGVVTNFECKFVNSLVYFGMTWGRFSSLSLSLETPKQRPATPKSLAFIGDVGYLIGNDSRRPGTVFRSRESAHSVTTSVPAPRNERSASQVKGNLRCIFQPFISKSRHVHSLLLCEISETPVTEGELWAYKMSPKELLTCVNMLMGLCINWDRCSVRSEGLSGNRGVGHRGRWHCSYWTLG